MRAVVITRPGGPEVLEVQEVETPELVGDYVRVRVRASGVNRADLMQRAGAYPAPAGSPSNIPGLEFAGEVDAVGPLVRMWKPGQRVMGLVGGGGQAQYILGTAAIQLADATGATTFGTSRTPGKLERARQLGLDFGLSSQNFAAEVNRLTNNGGVHVVLDFIGAPYLEQNLEALTSWGRIVFLSTMGGVQAKVNLGMLISKRISMRGCTLRTRTLEEKLAVMHRFATSVLPLLAKGKVKPVIEQVYAMEEVGKAHVEMGENKNFGKLIVRVE